MKPVIKIVIAGILFAVVSQIVHTLSAFIEMPYYLVQNYFAVWSKIMMPGAGPPGMEFYYYSIGFAIITGILLAAVFSKIRSGIPGEGKKKGLWYGFVLFLVAGLPGAFSMYLLINLPVALVAIWTVGNLVVYLLGGIVIERILR